MKTRVEVDNVLLEKALKLSHLNTSAEVMRASLEHYVAHVEKAGITCAPGQCSLGG
jgi:hypothetical protein